ncbi:conserved hypothetical protein [Hyphomicrobiales bacterium]|nr:conserved hypothetical protein [Hyphomicrobiales bacterium]CAH1699126.1 conserved hypothetical protein [Hyphomicrobiales bacterium]CAI0342916.1 CRP/FNR family transcriptional regulator, nitrogen oxide reductase regulator [Hyphomicrobiales bacterium]
MAIDFDILRRQPVFAALTPRERQLVAAAASPSTLAAEQRVFIQGEPASDFFLCLSGHIKLVRDDLGRSPVILRIVHPGEPFGLGRSVHARRHSATAIALSDCALAVWPLRSWHQFVHDMPGLPLGLIQLLERRLSDAQDRFVEIAALDVSRRIAHAILRLIDQAGRQEVGGVRIDFPVSRQDIAAQTGTTLHNVSRILTRWERQGVLSGGRRTLLVRDIPALMRLATVADASAAA